MSMSDPIADMLTRIRNALQAGHKTVDCPASRVKENVLAVLKQEGFITDYLPVESGAQGFIRVTLKYDADELPVIQGLKRISKPSLRVYAKWEDIQPVRSGLGVSIVSTSKGVVTGKQARDAKVGGEVLCEVW